MSEAAPAPLANQGQPVPRIDARLKVTGQARYGSDWPVTRPAYAYLVLSSVARGKITGFDDRDARAVPGVLDILTYQNTKVPGDLGFFGAGGKGMTAKKPLESDIVNYNGEIVAMVVAETYELAREAAYKVKISYESEAPTATMDSAGTEIHDASAVDQRYHDSKAGDANLAYLTAAVKVDAEYHTPTQHHNPIELFTTTCVWNGDDLTIYEPSQFVTGFKFGIAQQLKIKPENVKIISPFVGGAFGSKGSLTNRTALVAIAAKNLNRPVKLVATRSQGFTIATYRAETKHHIRLAAGRNGKLTSYWHEAWEMSSRTDDYVVGGTTATVAMYAAPNIWTKVHIVKGDRNTPGFMRAPAEVPYMYALESAIDEMAVALEMDPVELRRINDTKVNPENGAPYTSRSLMQCFDAAAKEFGWEKRNKKPASMRDGEWLIGWGCATACYPTQMNPSAVRVRFSDTGDIKVQVAAHDVGTGAYTVIAQTAAEWLNQPVEKVVVELGVSDLPPGPVAGGSVTTASVCSALSIACGVIQTKLLSKTGRDAMRGMTADNLHAAFAKYGSSTIEQYTEWAQQGARPGAIKDLNSGGVGISGGPEKDRTMFAFGAEFVEVRINERTKEIRTPRIVGAFAAGRILNPRTARSQLMGGMIWGVSSALHEATEIDERNARYVNDDLAEYLVPVNKDIDQLKVIFIPEVDEKVNPAGVKGVGELGGVGTAAAVTNAVYHATGKRLRDLPIRLDDLLA